MRKTILTTAAVLFLSSGSAMAHCEIPCGVFDDGARFDSIMEHATTIEKSMNEINKHSADEKPDYHTISRWTTNKEEHAKEVQHIASQYFLAQRVKVPGEDASEDTKADYVRHTTLLHQIIVAAMKTKHGTDTAAVEKLRTLTEEYKAHYFKKHGHEH